MSDSVRLIVLISGLAALASAEIQSLSQVKKVPFEVCVDDSDCRGLGPDYDCFQYICYPWRDDSKIAKANRMELCRSNNECSGGKECFRHHNRRSVTKGLCMEPAVDCQENGEADCKAPKGSKGRGSLSLLCQPGVVPSKLSSFLNRRNRFEGITPSACDPLLL